MLVALGCAAPAAHASLGVPTGGPPISYPSLGAFEAAAGGADNGTTAGEQASGFRHVNWDNISVNGSDPGSTVIATSHVIAPARTRLQAWGLELGPEIAVANDGFHSVNSNANFTPFSAPNVWGPFNSTMPTAEFDIVAPADQGTTPTPAQTRGVGIVFLGSTGSSQIQYYNGDILLDSLPVPAGATSFAGELFPDPVVTRVVVQLGGAQAEIFSFDGSAVTPGGSSPVAGDDVALAEPAPARPDVTATAGVPVSPVLDTFTNTESQATAVIDWGDGTRSNGTIVPASGGAFNVTGTHAYAQSGSYTATVTVRDFAGNEQTSQTGIDVALRATATSVSCSPSSVAVTATTTCTATVSDTGGAGASTPTGLLSFSSTTTGAGFGQDGGCLLAPTVTSGVASCAVQFTPSQRLSNQAHLAVTYSGDAAHGASGAAGTVGIRPQRCTLSVLTRRRLRPQGVGVLVTCDARSGVQIGVKAVVARKGKLRGFQLKFGTVRASVGAARPTVLLVKPVRGVLPPLRTALRRHQHVSLRLTLTASSQAVSKQTTTRVSAFRLG